MWDRARSSDGALRDNSIPAIRLVSEFFFFFFFFVRQCVLSKKKTRQKKNEKQLDSYSISINKMQFNAELLFELFLQRFDQEFWDENRLAVTVDGAHHDVTERVRRRNTAARQRRR